MAAMTEEQHRKNDRKRTWHATKAGAEFGAGAGALIGASAIQPGDAFARRPANRKLAQLSGPRTVPLKQNKAGVFRQTKADKYTHNAIKAGAKAAQRVHQLPNITRRAGGGALVGGALLGGLGYTAGRADAKNRAKARERRRIKAATVNKSIWGVDHGTEGNVSKRDNGASGGRLATGALFPGYHGLFAGKKGSKLKAAGTEIGGATAGMALGAATRNSSMASIGAMGGGAGATAFSHKKGWYKSQKVNKAKGGCAPLVGRRSGAGVVPQTAKTGGPGGKGKLTKLKNVQGMS